MSRKGYDKPLALWYAFIPEDGIANGSQTVGNIPTGGGTVEDEWIVGGG